MIVGHDFLCPYFRAFIRFLICSAACRATASRAASSAASCTPSSSDRECRATHIVVVVSPIFMDEGVMRLRQIGTDQLREIHPCPAAFEIVFVITFDKLTHCTRIARLACNRQPVMCVRFASELFSDLATRTGSAVHALSLVSKNDGSEKRSARSRSAWRLPSRAASRR
jgi:hypothetical protein